MSMRTLGLSIASALVLTFGAGCDEPAQKTAGAPATPTPTPPPQATASNEIAQPGPAPLPEKQDTVGRVHWLGKKRLDSETNAAHFMGIWRLPESSRLEAQALDKLALAIGQWKPDGQPGPITNYSSIVASHPAAALIRPLIEDLIQEESYLELRQAGSNQPGELALAIKLSTNSTERWLAAATNALFPFSSRCQVSRAGDWTVLGFSAPTGTGPGSNSLHADLIGRLQNASALKPFNLATLQPEVSNAWVEADIDLARASTALALNSKLALPSISLAVFGDGTNVRTRAELEFSKPLGWELEPWNVPTNLIREPLVGFSAVRGIRPWIESFKPWNDLQLGTAPCQAFFWAQSGAPALHFAAFPSADATNQANKLVDYVLGHFNPVIASSGLGAFQPTGSHRMVWRGVPILSPWIDAASSSNSLPFLFAGLTVIRSGPSQPPPAQLLEQLDSSTNLVWYDWEFTQPCLQSLTTMAQIARHLFLRPRLPAESPILPWIVAVSPKLGNCVTTLNAASPTHLSLLRKSSAGFTAAEIQLLADWLEAPAFPCGLFTFPPKRPLGGQDGPPSPEPKAPQMNK